jgi:hypothetical protein
MNRDKSLYFRKVTNIADDDDSGASVAIPVSSIHYIDISTAAVRIHFNSIHSTPEAGQAPDTVVLPCGATLRAELMAEKILEAINYGEDGFIIVVDNVTETYLSEDNCTDVTSINISG